MSLHQLRDRVTGNALDMPVLPYDLAAFSPNLWRVSYRCMTWESVVTAPWGQLMSDTNLCISFKAANVVLCVSYSTPQILGINTNKSKSNLLYEAYRLPDS